MVFDDKSHKNSVKCEAKTVAAFEAEFDRMSFLGFESYRKSLEDTYSLQLRWADVCILEEEAYGGVLNV